jgi:alpha-mannosidase
MTSDGAAYPANMFPKELNRGGVDFLLGPTADGEKNALVARGQTLDLPAGDFNRVHLLVAADGDTTGEIKLDSITQPLNIPDWTGYIGQWDNRIWDNPTHKIDLEPRQPPTGLAPGYIKRTPVAWFATHHNTPKEDAYYSFSYLFELSYDLPSGTKTLTLPDDPSIRVFAVSVANEPSATPPAAPLYDTLADHQPGGAPIITQAGKTFNAATPITLLAPLYHQPGDLRYTLDGSDPTPNSAAYVEPFLADDTVRLAVAQISEKGELGPIVRGVIEIHDHSPPELVNVLAKNSQNAIELTFSKPVDPTVAVKAENYSVQPSLPISKITQSPDGRQVTLAFTKPIPSGTDFTISLRGIKDTTRYSNVIVPTDRPFNADNIVYTLKSAQLPEQQVKTAVNGLPLQKSDTWTMNLLVNPDREPASLTVIAGFGQDRDNGQGGTSRYFGAFDDGIRFWSANRDVETGSPLEVDRWQMLTATYDGKTLTVYKDGNPIGKRDIALSNDPNTYVSVGMPDPWNRRRTFHGEVQDFTIRRGALTRDEVRQLYAETKPDR